MENFKDFIERYQGMEYHLLPNFIKRKVNALKNIQLKHIEIEHQYFKELKQLEVKYEKLYSPLYEKREKIVNGDYEPSDEEATLPENVVEAELDGNQENSDHKHVEILNEKNAKDLEKQIKGIPGFWLGCFLSSYNLGTTIEDCDRKILLHLKNVKSSYGDEGDNPFYRIHFEFKENPYFTNKELTKTYYMKIKPDEKDPFGYDGFEVLRSEGCKIDWKEGENVTTKMVTVKQKNKKDGRVRESKREKKCDSFFNFFSPPQLPEDEELEFDEDLHQHVAIDFELGESIRSTIIPKAVLYYSGYLIDMEDDEEDEFDDEFDDDDDDDDDDSESESADSDEDGRTDDSLNDEKTKKKN